MKVGYVRVSSIGQNTARQEVIMEELGVEKVFIDKVSGKDTERPQLKQMMEYVREGDSVTVESISRFARNVQDLLNLTDTLRQKEVKFISQKENIDTSTPMGKFLLVIFGAIAEMERESILERQREGIAIAKLEGKYKGRKPKKLDDFENIYNDWKNGDITASGASRVLCISRSTFYRKVEEYEEVKDTNE